MRLLLSIISIISIATICSVRIIVAVVIIDVIISILYANFLIPEYEGKHPVSAEPAPKAVHSLIKAPLATAGHHILVA